MAVAEWTLGSLTTGHEDTAAKIKEHNTASISPPDECLLTALPAELMNIICLYLLPQDLTAFSLTCRALHSHALQDCLWQHHVQHHIPSLTIEAPTPYETYRDLYLAHDSYWFIVKHKIWFSDLEHTGKLIIASYNPTRGCIEGYELVAKREIRHENNTEIDIPSFKPHLYLQLATPVLRLDTSPLKSLVGKSEYTIGKFHHEKPMQVNGLTDINSHLLLTNSVPFRPGMKVWPPEHIPSMDRVQHQTTAAFHALDNTPRQRSEVCNRAFRIQERPRTNRGIQQMEALQTFSTLDLDLYTPTANYPLRGIWVGDYMRNGCEFIIILQPERREMNELNIGKMDDEKNDEFTKRSLDERIYSGSVTAVKLTGDQNVPRGEVAFIANDIGEKGLVNVSGGTFKGLRVVHCTVHIAEHLYTNGMQSCGSYNNALCLRPIDRYIDTQLIIISPDKLAQHYVDHETICYYNRVDINEFLTPLNVPHQA